MKLADDQAYVEFLVETKNIVDIFKNWDRFHHSENQECHNQLDHQLEGNGITCNMEDLNLIAIKCKPKLLNNLAGKLIKTL